MARIPTFDQPTQAGAVRTTLQPVAVPTPTLARVQQSLGEWQQQVFAENEAAAMQRATEAAFRQQAELGTAGVAQPDAAWATRFQQEFSNRARALQSEQLKTDAIRQINTLQREHWNDPAGFEAAYSEYANATFDSIRQTDPTTAYASQLMLEQLGARGLDQLEDAAFAFQQQQASAEATTAIRERTSELHLGLLRNPRDDLMFEQLDDISQAIDELLATRTISPEAAENLKRQARRDLAKGLSWGHFERMVENSDFAGAQGVIDSLWDGGYFDSLDASQTEARAMQVRLNASAGSGVDNGMSLRILREASASIAHGVEPRAADYVEIAQHVRLHGSPDEAHQAEQYLAALATAEAVRGEVNGLGAEELLSLAAFLRADPHALPSGPRGHLLKQVEDRARVVQEASFTRDYARLVPTAPGDPLTPQQRAEAASVVGVRPQDVRQWTDKMEQEFSASLRRAASTGDTTRFSEVAEEYFTGMSLQQQIGATFRLAPDVSGSAHVALLARQLGNDDIANEWVVAAAAGSELSGAPMPNWRGRVTRLPDADVRMRFDALGLDDRFAALGFGSVVVEDEIRSAAFNAFKFYLNQTKGDRKTAGRFVERLFEPFEVATVRGRDVPVALLGQSPGERAAAASILDDFLRLIEDEPERVQVAAPMLPFLHPVPNTAGDGWNLWNPLTDGLAVGRDGDPVEYRPDRTGEMLLREDERVGPDPGRAEFQRRVQEAEAPGRLERMLDTAQGRLGEVTAWSERRQAQVAIERAAAGVKGVDAEFVRKVYKAVLRAPEAELVGRTGPMRLQGQVQRDLVGRIQQEVAGAVIPRDPLSNAVSWNAAALHLADLRKKYGDDQKVLAAYWGGEDLVDTLVAAYGERWLSQAGPEVRAFLRRAENDGAL